MKTASKIFITLCFFIFALAICAYAKEEKSAKINTTSSPTATSMIPSGTAPATMAPPVEKTTLDNLQAAFNGESNARARYLAFAKKADEEEYGKAASLFRAAARAEQSHLARHAKVIKKLGGVPAAMIDPAVVKSTAENLETAMKGETYESTVMYPEFLAKAQKEKIKAAVDAFEDAGATEAVHAGLYKKALENLPEWKGKSKKFEVCSFCGNVVEKINFKDCPICGKSKSLYVSVR
ncbi:MAG: rubrerythrin family protein [Candidatus Omnitrophota bacterium]|jgi:rubrerythrin